MLKLPPTAQVWATVALGLTLGVAGRSGSAASPGPTRPTDAA
jgi:hypothetical protein